MMALADVLTRLVVVYLRGRRLVRDGCRPGAYPGRHRCLIWYPVPAAGQAVSMRHGWPRRVLFHGTARLEPAGRRELRNDAAQAAAAPGPAGRSAGCPE